MTTKLSRLFASHPAWRHFSGDQTIWSWTILGWIVNLTNGWFCGNCFERGLSVHLYQATAAYREGRFWRLMVVLQTRYSITTHLIIESRRISLWGGHLAFIANMWLKRLGVEREYAADSDDWTRTLGPVKVKSCEMPNGDCATVLYLFGRQVSMDM